VHIFVRFERQSFFNALTHSRPPTPTDIKGCAAALLNYVMSALALHERHDASVTLLAALARVLDLFMQRFFLLK